MEVQRVPGLDFEELGLVAGIVRKIQPHSSDKDLWVHFFQDSLSKTQLHWFYQLERSDVHNWEDLAAAF